MIVRRPQAYSVARAHADAPIPGLLVFEAGGEFAGAIALPASDTEAAVARLLSLLGEAPQTALVPPAPGEYLGRRIARTMHWKGAEWLLRETRESEEHTLELLGALRVERGWTIADLGCGVGYHTLPLARRVGAEGVVYGVDVQRPMIDRLRMRMEQGGARNVRPILCTAVDTYLLPASCDLILLADVYHELSHPEQVLASARAALKPGGRIVLVEFRAEDPAVPIKLPHKMTKAQVRKELEANGFALVEEYDELPWQHVMFFRAAAENDER